MIDDLEAPPARRPSVRDFRTLLGGTWQAHRRGWGTWTYTGQAAGHTFEVYANSYYTPRYEGDDSDGAYTTYWTVECDGRPLPGGPTSYPAHQIAYEMRPLFNPEFRKLRAAAAT